MAGIGIEKDGHLDLVLSDSDAGTWAAALSECVGPLGRNGSLMTDDAGVHPLGLVAWRAAAQIPDCAEIIEDARAVRTGVFLSVAFESHPAYAPLQTITRLAGFAVEQVQSAREALSMDGGPQEDFGAVWGASTDLEYAVVALHRAVVNARWLRRTGGQWTPFSLVRFEPAMRGDSPFAISKQEFRLIGPVDQLQDLRNALEHADRRTDAGNTQLVPRELGVTFDALSLRYDNLVGIGRRLISMVREMLNSGTPGIEIDAQQGSPGGEERTT